MHENIKKFSLSGEMNDASVEAQKESLIRNLETQMRDNGVLPILDMEPQFSWKYIPEENKYSFELSVYGAKVGIEAAWRNSGIMNGKIIAKTTAPIK